MKLSLTDVLLAYSEFLADEGLMRSVEEKPDDQRFHNELVKAFLESQLENLGQDYNQTEACGAWGGCPLPSGHNRGLVDIPENHGTHDRISPVSGAEPPLPFTYASEMRTTTFLQEQICIDCGATCWPHPYKHPARYRSVSSPLPPGHTRATAAREMRGNV